MGKPRRKQKKRTYRNKKTVPIWEKQLLTLEEAAAYSGIGINKLRQMSNTKSCDWVLWNSGKRLLKRKKLCEFLDRTYSI